MNDLQSISELIVRYNIDLKTHFILPQETYFLERIQRQMKWDDGVASTGLDRNNNMRPTIMLPPNAAPTSNSMYWTLMHEIGHVACRHIWANKPDLTFDEIVRFEAEAWRWAIKNAWRKPSALETAYIRECYGSYVEYWKSLGCSKEITAHDSSCS